MQRPVLADKGTAVDTHNLVIREGLLKHFGGTAIVVGLVVSGVEHGFVQDEKVGIGSRQAFAIFDDGIGHGQGEQTIGLAFQGSERFQLLFHEAKGFVMFVSYVGTLHVYDGVVGTKACQGIDMAICVVTRQLTVIQPENLLYMKSITKVCLYLFLSHLSVAIGGKQTF